MSKASHRFSLFSHTQQPDKSVGNYVWQGAKAVEVESHLLTRPYIADSFEIEFLSLSIAGANGSINYLWLPWQFSHISQLNRHHWIAWKIHEDVQNQTFLISLGDVVGLKKDAPWWHTNREKKPEIGLGFKV